MSEENIERHSVQIFAIFLLLDTEYVLFPAGSHWLNPDSYYGLDSVSTIFEREPLGMMNGQDSSTGPFYCG